MPIQGDTSRGSVKDSVILTLFDRDSVTLAATFRGLLKNDLTDTEIVIVNDRSGPDFAETYQQLVQQVRNSGIHVSYVTPEPYEAYRIGQHNNPARVNNIALALARGERIFWLSSDTILQPQTLDRARQFDLNHVVYSPQVIDMDTAAVFNGPQRVYPMMWFLATTKKACLDCGGFEEYLKGMAFEDNDFVGRLACHVGRMAFDWSIVCYHQSHEPVAYSDDMTGYKISAEYTKKKWRGVPFVSARPALKIVRGMHELGVPEWAISKMNQLAPASG